MDCRSAMIGLALLALAGCVAAPPPGTAVGSGDGPWVGAGGGLGEGPWVGAGGGLGEGPGTWRLVALNGVPPAGPVTLRFEDGRRIVGQGPCNRYFGTYAGIAPDFRPGTVGATQMACDRLAEEQRYFDALSRVNRIERGPATLTLSGPGVRLDYATPMF